MRGLVISAPASAQGKTTVTLGLLRAFRRRGLDVAPAKAGPDYIDPAFHRAAAGRDSATLDPWAMGAEDLRARVPQGGLVVIEGAMGLFDGAPSGGPEGLGATAALARALDLPVVLVIDGAKAAQTVGAVVAGLAGWDPDLHVAGVILNRVGSDRHRALLEDAVARVCPVIGAVRRDPGLVLPSRHLGLVQAGEIAGLEAFLDRAADAVEAGCDLDALLALAVPAVPTQGPAAALPPLGQRIAVARDVAFAFAYPHMLADWQAAGAEILPFSPLAGAGPDPSADAVFLPGGYPELHAGSLTGTGFQPGLQAAAARGALIYGECGGYMVLGTGLIDADGTRHAMAGLLPLETSFAERRLHLGYRALTGGPGPLSGALRGHEFHYATTLRAEGTPLFRAADAAGAPLPAMGLRAGRVMGSFAHLIAPT